MMKIAAIIALALLAFLVIRFRALGNMSQNLPVKELDLVEGRLPVCSSKMNCVSSVEGSVLSLKTKGSASENRDLLKKIVKGMNGQFLSEKSGVLHFSFKSEWFGFVDDLWLHALEDGTIIDVRSASRVGKSDLGVNKRRVELLHQLWNQNQ